MADVMLEAWETEAARMRRRALTGEEKKALSEEMLKGTLRLQMDKRARKNAIRTAIDRVRPGTSGRLEGGRKRPDAGR